MAMLRILTLGGLAALQDSDRTVVAMPPRRLAVLALIGRAGMRGITREKLLSVLWPDMPEEQARAALNQQVYTLRRSLGNEAAVQGVQELRLNPDLAVCDAVEFDLAYGRGDLQQAVALYAGEFLDGFRLAGADDFERWLEAERNALARRLAEVLERLARAAADDGDAVAASGWWRRLAARDPLDGRVAAQLMRALEQTGDRRGALQHAQVYAALVEQQLQLPPAPEVLALAERIRSEPAPPQAAARPLEASPTAAPIPDSGGTSAPAVRPAGRAVDGLEESAGLPVRMSPAPRTRRMMPAAALAAGVLALTAYLASGPPARSFRENAVGGGQADDARGVVLAVGSIGDYAGDGSDGAALGDMLATNLARTDGVRVLSTARIRSLLAPGAAPADFHNAARGSGATELIEGSLYRSARGSLRFDVRRTDLASGLVRAAFSLEAPDLFQAADSATARLADGLGLRAPVGGLVRVSTRSALAYGLYEKGLRAYFGGDHGAATHYFRSALEEDSTFAMAAYYLAQSDAPSRTAGLRARLLRLSESTGERERLAIRSFLAYHERDPRLPLYADSLVNRYPHEVEGYLYTGYARLTEGQWAGAVRALERAVEMDSASLKTGRLPCNACTGILQLVNTHQLSDSLTAAEREARRWVRMQPASAEGWRTLAEVLLQAGRGEEALGAFDHAARLDPGRTERWAFVAVHHLRSGRHAEADSVLADVVQRGTDPHLGTAWELLIYSLRNQGRLREALAASNEAQRIGVAPWLGNANLPRLDHAQILFDMGRFRESAAAHAAIADLRVPSEPESYMAAHRILYLAHAAFALARAGETFRLPALADSIRVLGARSLGFRGNAMYGSVRGLVLAAEGRHEEAITGLQRALYSPNQGFSEINVTLAELLLQRGRAPEAVAALTPLLRGQAFRGTAFVTRVEVHARLGSAWEAAGRPDSAAYHYESAVRAWRSADPELRPRRDEAERRLRALRAQLPGPDGSAERVPR
jgi:DNA-binding SARP family transcriptional activator